MRDRHQLQGRVEGAGIELAGLHHDDRGSAARRARRGEGIRLHPPLLVRGDPHDAIMAEAEQLQRKEHGGMRVVADQHVDRRRAEQPARLDVPADPPQHLATGRREAGGVRDGGTGHEPDRGVARQVDQIEQPACRSFLSGRRGRRRVVIAGILAPGAGQPVGRDPDRVRGADHPAKEARAGHRAQPRLGRARQLLDHGVRRQAALRRRSAERGLHDLIARHRTLGAIRDRAAKGGRPPRGALPQPADVRAHGCLLEQGAIDDRTRSAASAGRQDVR